MYQIWKEYWNESLRYPCWDIDNDYSTVFTNASIEEVEAFVNQENQKFIDNTIANLIERLNSTSKEISQTEDIINILSQMDKDQLNLIGVNISSRKTQLKNLLHSKKQIEIEIENIKTNPFDSQYPKIFEQFCFSDIYTQKISKNESTGNWEII
jgi:acyl carrier protein phosphodiesterase